MSTDKTAIEILDEYGCPEIPNGEFVTMYYPNILKAMEAYATAKMGAYKAPVDKNNFAFECLKELVRLKRIKDNIGETLDYKENKDAAWQNAFKAVESPTPSPIEKLIGQINADVYLELINDIMWNTWAVKDRPFGRAEGEEIMKVLNQWAKSESPTPVSGEMGEQEIENFIFWAFDNNWVQNKKDEWWNFGIPESEQVKIPIKELLLIYKAAINTTNLPVSDE